MHKVVIFKPRSIVIEFSAISDDLECFEKEINTFVNENSLDFIRKHYSGISQQLALLKKESKHRYPTIPAKETKENLILAFQKYISHNIEAPTEGIESFKLILMSNLAKDLPKLKLKSHFKAQLGEFASSGIRVFSAGKSSRLAVLFLNNTNHGAVAHFFDGHIAGAIDSSNSIIASIQSQRNSIRPNQILVLTANRNFALNVNSYKYEVLLVQSKSDKLFLNSDYDSLKLTTGALSPSEQIAKKK